jgi:lysophospholipase L1-like esterase
VGFIGFAELVLRAGWGFGNPPLVQADTDVGYLFKANQNLKRFGNRVIYNQYGLRSAPIQEWPARGRIRILCLGDSVTNGGSLTDQSLTYPYRLEAQLGARGVRAETLNASAGGWAPANELAFLRTRGTFHARTVVLEIGTNDLCQMKAGPEIVGSEDFPSQAPISAIGELLTRYVWPRLTAAVRPAQPQEPIDCSSELRTQVLRTIGDMIGESRRHGAPPVILLMPDRAEVENREDASSLRDGLFKLAQSEHVPLTDMLPRFRAFAARGESDFRDGVHPNPAGDQRMAEAVADMVLEMLPEGGTKPSPVEVVH